MLAFARMLAVAALTAAFLVPSSAEAYGFKVHGASPSDEGANLELKAYEDGWKLSDGRTERRVENRRDRVAKLLKRWKKWRKRRRNRPAPDPVPEPGTLGLIALGSAAIGYRIRKRKSEGLSR